MTANHVRHRQRQQTYRRRKKDAQRTVCEFERREAAAAAWARGYWQQHHGFARVLRAAVPAGRGPA